MPFDEAPPPDPPIEARPRDATGFGGTISGLVGASAIDTGLSAAAGFDAPDPLGDASVRAVGSPVLAGLSSDLVVRVSDTRFALGTAMAFGDGPALLATGVRDGFTIDAQSTIGGAGYFGVGRQLRFGPVMPYVDLLAGLSFLQTKVRLHHEAHGFLGETPYDALRFSFGPRAGVVVPLGSLFHVDLGGRIDLFGYVRFTTFAGLGAFLPL